MEVIKRKGKSERYQESKVYASCYAAAINCHYGDKKAESIASKTSKQITKWIKKQKAPITSSDIKKKVIETLKDKDVVLMYKHHLDLS
ncbi:hypothetical protein KW787_03505 [Candidatus Pacearchaeota archaeon]|nr:hypothetical protein [Candidatus Pacearchaeota archaeon]